MGVKDFLRCPGAGRAVTVRTQRGLGVSRILANTGRTSRAPNGSLRTPNRYGRFRSVPLNTATIE